MYLIDHLSEVLSNARRILTGMRSDLSVQLHQSILLAAALHDIGKVDKSIQNFFRLECQNGVRKKKHPPKSHALIGLPIIQGLLSGQLPEPYLALTMLAVASHHTPLHNDLYLNMNPTLDIAREDRDETTDILNNLDRLLAKDSNLSFKTELDWECFPSPKTSYVQAKENGIGAVVESKDPEKWRWEYVLMQGTLEHSDWLASGNQKVAERLTFPQTFCSARGTRIDADLTQKIAEKTMGNIFVLRPTGRHKTETALFWARANTSASAKVFYVLPTTVTINAMFKRLEKNFPSQTGLYHSSADLFLDQLHPDENVDDLFTLHKYFFFPVNVTTPDQIILSLLNYKRYTLKSLPLQGSTIILDEIHAYDGETFALIKGMVRRLSQSLGAKFCIMSATFPKIFQRELSFLGPLSLIPPHHTQGEYESLRRTQYKYIEEPMMNHIDTILRQCLRPGTVLIVLNTVKRAQDVYRELFKQLVTARHELNETDLMLLHARYTYADREVREARLDPEHREKHPKILVATQIVEVSLDISYDTMFTEACYPADLVQRVGRVNREGGPTTKVNVFVYRPENHFPYEKGPLLENGLPMVKKWESEIRSESDYLTMANQFYDQVWYEFKSPEDERRYEEVWNVLSYLYSADLSDTEVLKLLRTRSGVITLPAFPAGHEKQVETLNTKIEALNKRIEADCDAGKRALREKRDLLMEKRRLLVDVPVTKRTLNLFEKKGRDRYINSPYDQNYGLQINSSADNIL